MENYTFKIYRGGGSSPVSHRVFCFIRCAKMTQNCSVAVIKTQLHDMFDLFILLRAQKIFARNCNGLNGNRFAGQDCKMQIRLLLRLFASEQIFCLFDQGSCELG